MDLSLAVLFIFTFAKTETKMDRDFEVRGSGDIDMLDESIKNIDEYNTKYNEFKFYKNICNNIKSIEESKKDICNKMCKEVQNYCTQQEYGFVECMKDKLNKGKASQILSQYGCKFPESTCDYSKWSEWSKCSRNCLSRDYFPTRYRTRKLINNKANSCPNDDQGTIEFEVCANLPPCKSKKSIRTSIAISDGKRLKRNKRGYESGFPEWVEEALERYPDLGKSFSEYEEEEEESGKYQIMKSIKNMGILSTKCGCGSGYSEMNFLTFIESEKMMQQLDRLCRINKYNQLVFEGNGRYVYYCISNMMFKESEDDEPRCEDVDSTEYVACKKEYEGGTEMILFLLHEGMKVLGTIVKDLLVFVYGSIASMVLIGLIVWWLEEKKQTVVEDDLE